MVNILFIFGALASLKAVLTLPGIAGIVLTIGISVDANVLIFERIREELAKGKSQADSIKDGFKLWDDREDGSQEVAEAALIPVLVNAIQELTTKIEVLEQEAGYHLDTIILDGTNGSSANAGGNILLG